VKFISTYVKFTNFGSYVKKARALCLFTAVKMAVVIFWLFEIYRFYETT